MIYVTARRGAVHLAADMKAANTLCGRDIDYNRARRCEETVDTEFATCVTCVTRVQPWHLDGGPVIHGPRS